MLFLSVRPNSFLVQYAGNLGNCLNATDVRCESIETSMDAQAANFEEEEMDFFCPSPLPFGGSTVLRLTRGPAGNRTTTGSLSATQECRD